MRSLPITFGIGMTRKLRSPGLRRLVVLGLRIALSSYLISCLLRAGR